MIVVRDPSTPPPHGATPMATAANALHIATTDSPVRTRKPRQQPASGSTAKLRPSPSAKQLATGQRHAWSHSGVVMCVGMSACLNAYANSMHATIAWAGAILGIMIPCLVLVLSKVAGMQYRSGGRSRTLAYFTAGVGVSLLALSVYHCACSLALLTGSPFVCACMMAVTIDGGLVACELDIVLA